RSPSGSALDTCRLIAKSCLNNRIRYKKKTAKSPDYTGYLVVLAMNPGVKNEHTEEDWEAAPRLTVFGRRVRNADNSVRIALDVLPKRSNENVSDEEVGF
ncbi:MAG: hypothetical protein VB135_02330, partial [Burkholderia sp.]